MTVAAHSVSRLFLLCYGHSPRRYVVSRVSALLRMCVREVYAGLFLMHVRLTREMWVKHVKPRNGAGCS
jgi:hypothetical protein